MKGVLITLGHVAVLLSACGGRPRLVVELGAPVEITEERSTGFDRELSNDNGNATFMGMRLVSPTVFVSYEQIEVHTGGEQIWDLESPHLAASVFLLDGIVMELQILGEPITDLARVETIGRQVTARFDAWKKRDPTYWSYVVRDFGSCGETRFGKVEAAGTFVHESGVEALVLARCMVNPGEISYRIDVEMRTADAPR